MLQSVKMDRSSAFLAFIVLMSMFLAFFIGGSNQAFADGDTAEDATEVGVEMGSDGKLSITGGGFTQEDGQSAAWNKFFKKYKNIISGISGIAAITFIAFFIFYFMKLGASAGNPQARSNALLGVLWTGLAAAGLGAVSIVVGFFYNALG